MNVKDALCSLMMESPTKEWDELTSPGLMSCKTSTQEALQTESISNSVRKGHASITYVDSTILADSS